MDTITEAEIAARLSRHHGSRETALDRELVTHARPDDHGGRVGSVVYSLRGSPPKGYAIEIPELRLVNFYDVQGERFHIERNATVNHQE